MNRILLSLLIVLQFQNIQAQIKPINYNMLFVSADFSSNTSTFGYTQSEIKQPNYSSSVSFYSKHNFDLNYSAIITDNADSSFSKAVLENDISAGYTFNFNDKLSLYPSYSHMFHSQNSYALKSVFTDFFQTDLSYADKIYNSNLTLSYLHGKKDMFYLSMQNALGFEKEEFLLKNSLLNVQLGFYLNISDKNYYNTFIYDDWTKESFLQWIYNKYTLRPITIALINNYIEENSLNEAKQWFNENYLSKEPELFETKYALTSIDFYLPIYYSLGNFMFNLTGYISIPTSTNEFFERENTFFLNTGISYTFIL